MLDKRGVELLEQRVNNELAGRIYSAPSLVL